MNGQLKHIGDFKTEFEAAEAYDDHAVRLGKPLNYPQLPKVCSQCGNVPKLSVPVPKPRAASKSPSPPPGGTRRATGGAASLQPAPESATKVPQEKSAENNDPRPVCTRLHAPTRPLLLPPNVDSESARAILASQLNEHDLESRLAAAKPFTERMQPFTERENTIMERAFLFGLIAGASDERLFSRYFPSQTQTGKKTKKKRNPESTNKLSADDAELEAIGEESAALMRAPLMDRNVDGGDEKSEEADNPKYFSDFTFSPTKGTASFAFTPNTKRMRVGNGPGGDEEPKLSDWKNIFEDL